MEALKMTHPPFTIFAPKSPSTGHRSGTELRFARLNNANPEKFNRRERTTKDIEDEIHRHKRYDAASKITSDGKNFKSIGTPSSPPRPSIPGRKSNYTKPPKPYQNPNSDDPHPAFRHISRVSKVPVEADRNVSIGEHGVSYKITNAPFEFQYSYTETPKVKPLGLREPAFVPFGPKTMPRPWTGRAPLPGTKKKLPEFDSFKLPPPHKKGVKPVQSPGPFLAGSGPRYVSSREEILGEPLTKEEIKELVKSCVKTRRQLNMGRDGFTHNMLENIHALWKRRRVCKIKCKGVCTVDMDNVCQQLEEKTGGKIIYKRGGVLFLFRGRNYNHMSRPRFPLMLWKPVAPIYPRLIKQAPEGLTVKEADEMRKRGRELPSICKLGKNGLYSKLVKHVREAFEECELVRINCEGMNGSDYRKIGGKLKDLVPCVLISFEREHILVWRGRDWKSTSTKVGNEFEGVKESETHSIRPSNSADSLSVEYHDSPDLLDIGSSDDEHLDNLSTNTPLVSESPRNDQASEPTETDSSVMNVDASSSPLSDGVQRDDDESTTLAALVMSENGSATILESTESTSDKSEATLSPPWISHQHVSASDNTSSQSGFQTASEGSPSHIECKELRSTCTEGVLRLLSEAVESGLAVILDDTSLDANIVYERVVALHKVAPCGPVFRHRLRKKTITQKTGKQDSGVFKVETVVTVSGARSTTISGVRSEKKSYRDLKIKDLKPVYPDDILPQGSLGVDELAKLLS